MIRPKPEWSHLSQRPLYQWYGHVDFFDGRVLGQWFCLDEDSGKLLWEKEFERPNTLVDVADGVVVATETRSDGPWTLNFGSYGISLRTGELLWTAHRGPRPGLGRILDWLVGNQLKDTAVHVDDGKVHCESGRILDLKSGLLIGQSESPTDPGDRQAGDPQAGDPGWVLYHDHAIELDDGRRLTTQDDSDPANPEPDDLTLFAWQGDELVWSFQLSDHGFATSGNFYSYRLRPPFVYVIANPRADQRSPGTRFLAIDLATGQIAQELALSTDDTRAYRIESLDERGVLVSSNAHQLEFYLYERRAPR